MIDRFSILPAEIIQLVFVDLNSSDEALRLPISKRILPFQQQLRFKRARLASQDQLTLGCATVESGLSPLRYVEDLTIIIGQLQESGVTEESEDPSVPSCRQLQLFLRSLVRVKRLYVSGSSRIAGLLLTSQIAASSLPRITSLLIRSTLDDFDDPFHPAHYAVLSNYPELTHLALDIVRPSSSIRFYSKPLTHLNRFSSSITSVSLSGPLTTCKTSVTDLLNSIGYLDAVSLADRSDASRLYELLDGFDERAEITCLDLERTEGDENPPGGSIAYILDACPNLERLTVEGCCDLLTPSFYAALRCLPLKTLEINIGVDISLDQLTSVITGNDKLETLGRIEFNNVFGEAGSRIEEQGCPWTPPEYDYWDVYPDWYLPDWTDEFDGEKLAAFIEVAEREGIQVSGTAVEALAVDEGFEEELAELNVWKTTDYF
ncbi:hypothetical protein JCM5353_002377 [Sporobolomyces roseus]